MSLDFKAGNIKDWETVCQITTENGEKRWAPEFESVVLATMVVGIGEITEDNYMEFAKRCYMMSGLTRWGSSEWKKFNPEMIRRYIGLTTNVVYEPITKWFKRHHEMLERDMAYDERRRLKESAAA